MGSTNRPSNVILRTAVIESVDTDQIWVTWLDSGGEPPDPIPLSYIAGQQIAPMVGQLVVLACHKGSDAEYIAPLIVSVAGTRMSQDSAMVRQSSPSNLEPGEVRMTSKNGATLFLGNGGIILGSLGQSLWFRDDIGEVQLFCKDLHIQTGSCFYIESKKDENDEDTLVISKKQAPTSTENTLTITLKNDTITIDGKHIELGKEATEAAIKGTKFIGTYYNNHTHGSAVGPVTIPIQQIVMPPDVDKGNEVLSGITKIK